MQEPSASNTMVTRSSVSICDDIASCLAAYFAAFPIKLQIARAFFLNDTATTEIYTLSLHDALPILGRQCPGALQTASCSMKPMASSRCCRSEEHTSELQSRQYLVCRLLLEKKK